MKNHEIKMIRTHLYSENCVLREKVAEFLAETNSVRAGEALMKNMRSKNRYVATRAAWGLTLMNKKISIPLIIEALKDPETCRDASWALGRIDSKIGEKALARALKSSNPVIQKEAAGGLRGKNISKTPVVQKALIKMLDSDKGSATLTLGGTRTKAALDALAETVKNEKFFSKAMAILCLARAKDPRALKPALDMMQAKNHDRSTAMWALELLGSPAALDRVVDYAEGFKKEKDINAFNRFFKTLDSLKKNAAAEAVFPLLRERDYKRRAAGVAALAALASENSRECLVKMLADEHWFVRGAAAEGLGNIGNRLSAPNLIGVLSDRSWYVRRKAVLALVKLKASGSAAPLLKVFKDKNISVQEEAARALSEIADLGVADKMMAGLRKRDSFAWRYCMEYLGKVKVKKAVPVLIKVLSGGFWSEKVIAAESLGNIGDKRAIKPLKRLLKDNSAEVHMAAEKAIRQISEPKLKAFKYLYDAKIR